MLGLDGLVGPMLEDRRLVRLMPEFIPSPAGFHLKLCTRTSTNAQIFADWLQRTC